MKAILVAALLVSAPVFAAESDEDAVKTVFARLGTCFGTNDSACLGELFADDASVIGPLSGGKPIQGKREIVKFISDRLTARNLKQTHVVQHVRFLGRDHAVVDCTVEVENATPQEGMDPHAPREAWRSTSLAT